MMLGVAELADVAVADAVSVAVAVELANDVAVWDEVAVLLPVAVLDEVAVPLPVAVAVTLSPLADEQLTLCSKNASEVTSESSKL